MDKGFLNLISGGKEVNPNNFTSLLAGGKRNKNKKLKGISNKQFLRSPKLISEYGYFSDSDNDNWPNFKDCYPFNPNMHQAGPTIPQSLQPQLAKPQTVQQARQPTQIQSIAPVNASKQQAKQLQEKIEANQKEIQRLDAERKATIEEMRRTGSLNIGLRKRLNQEFQQKREDLLASSREISKVRSSIIKTGGTVDIKQLDPYLKEVVTYEARERRVEPRRSLLKKEIQLRQQLASGLDIEKEFEVEQKLKKIIGNKQFKKEFVDPYRQVKKPDTEIEIKKEIPFIEAPPKEETFSFLKEQRSISAKGRFEEALRAAETKRKIKERKLLTRGEIERVTPEPLTLKEQVTGTLGLITMPVDIITEPERFIPEKFRGPKDTGLFTMVPKDPIQLSGTIEYKTIPKGDLETQRALGEIIEQEKIGIEAKNKVNEIYNKYGSQIQGLINKGVSQKELEKTVNLYQKQAQNEANDFLKDLDEKYKTEYAERERERVVDWTKKEMSTNFWKNRVANLIRLGFYSVPVYGTILAVADIGETVTEAPATYKFLKEYPELRGSVGIEAGATVATFGLGGYGLGKIKGTIKQAKINEALKNAEVQINSKGLLTEAKLDALKLPLEQKMQLKNLIKGGNSLKYYETRLKPGIGFEKNTPKVSGKFVEVVDQFGNVIEKVSIGKLSAKLRGKTIDQISLSETIATIESKTGKVTGYTEAILAQQPRFVYDPITGKAVERKGLGYDLITGRPKLPGSKKFVFKETAEISDDIINPLTGQRTIRSKTASDLISKGAYRGEVLRARERLPDFDLLTGKHYIKGEVVTRLTPYAKDVNLITGESIGFLGTTTKYIDESFGIVKRVKVKPPKPSKGLGIIPDEALPKEIPTKAPKPFKAPPEPSVSRVTPSYVGGEGGLLAQSIYAGEQFKVPIGAEGISVTTAFTEGLGTGLTRGYGVTGLGFGVGVGIGTMDLDVVDNELKIKTGNIEQTKITLDTLNKSKINIKKQPKSPTRDLSLERINQDIKNNQRILEAQKVEVKQLTKQKQELKQELKVPTVPISPPTIPTIIPKIPFGISFPGEEEEIRRQQRIGYQGYVKVGRQWKKVTDKPYQKGGAWDKVARFVDRTLSAQGKVEPIKQTKIVKGKKKEVFKIFKKPLPKGDDYFAQNKYKFRSYKSKQGKIIPLKNKIIERQAYRLDLPGETKRIQKAKRRRGVSQFFGI